MKSALVTEIGKDFVIADVAIAAPIGHEVLVNVQASGLCHTDLTYSQNDIGYPVPSLLGHEVSGVVAEVGPDVTDVAVGDHVVACLIQYCGTCTKCLKGKFNQCTNPQATLRGPNDAPRLTFDGTAVAQGFGLGGFAEQALIHESQLVKIPAAVPFPQAALLGCGVVTGAGAVINSARVEAGDSVVVIGAGGVGLNAISGAIVAGATTIIAVDVADDKLDKARTFGATHTVNSTNVDPVEAVRTITGGGADAVFDFVGLAPVTLQGLAMAATGGGLYLVGIIDPRATISLQSHPDIIRGQKRIQGVIMGSTVPRHDIPMYADLYLQGRFNLDGLLSSEIALDDINEGYASLRNPEITRVVVTRF